MHIHALPFNLQMPSLSNRQPRGLEFVPGTVGKEASEPVLVPITQQDDIEESIVKFCIGRQAKVRADKSAVHGFKQNVVAGEIMAVEHDFQFAWRIVG